jgi:hypothetical protein
LFTGIRADSGDNLMVIANTVRLTAADFVESLAALAVIVTFRLLLGGAVGAVYVTELFVPPLRVPPPLAGEVIAHEAGFTPAFAGSKLTVAVIVDVPCAWSEERLAERETAMAANVMLMFPLAVESLAEVAVMVTCTSLGGGVAGAV